MPILSDHDEINPSRPIDDDWPKARVVEQRTLLQSCLPQIAEQVRGGLRDVGLSLEVFLTIPASGNSLMTFATAADPADEEWDRVRDIVRRIVGELVGAEGLRCRELACASSGTPMGAADVVDGAATSAG